MAIQEIKFGRSVGADAVVQEVVLADVGASDWYKMPNGVRTVIVEVVPGAGGTALAQMVFDETLALADYDGVDWDAGAVTAATQQATVGGGYIRLKSTVGSAIMTLTGIY